MGTENGEFYVLLRVSFFDSFCTFQCLFKLTLQYLILNNANEYISTDFIITHATWEESWEYGFPYLVF